MKPSVLIVVLVPVLIGASAGSACAQGPSGVYGMQGAGIDRGCDGCGARFDSGVAGDSRIGLRGNESVGGGMSVIFALEAGLPQDSGRSGPGSRLFGRQADAGWAGDPFKGGMAGGATNFMTNFAANFTGNYVGNYVGNYAGNYGGYARSQADDGLSLYSRDAGGGLAVAPYGFGERARDPAANRAWGVSFGLERGPLTIRLAHQNRNMAPVAPATAIGNNLDAKNSILAANLRLGGATAYAAYSANRGWGSSPLFNPDNPYGASMAATPSLDSRDVLVGLALPCGPATLLASFVRKNDRDLPNRDANQLAFGASYTLSRHTDFYASYSRITNRGGAVNSLPDATLSTAAFSALNLGMRHGF
jgi:predicted porin